jgi:hypothetical protein
MSKYDEIVEMARQAAIEVSGYQRESITFIETLAGEWGAYIEEGVSLVSIQEAQSSKKADLTKTAWQAMQMGDDGYWYCGLAINLFPRGGQLTIPLRFRGVKEGYKVQLINDRQNRTFVIKDLESVSFQPFNEYLWTSLEHYYKQSFKDFINDESSTQIFGFNRKALTETAEE